MASKETEVCKSLQELDLGTGGGGNGRKRYTISDISHAKSLEELVSQGARFKIIGYHKLNLSVLDIMPVGENDDDLFHLCEEILEVVEDENAKFKKRPKIFDVVLAKKDNKDYHRCIITDFLFKKKHAEVMWIDVGGITTVPVSGLKPVNEAIMEFARLAYTVVLEDMFPRSNFVLYTAYEQLITSLRKVQFTVTLGQPSPIGTNLYSDKMVKMTYKSGGQILDLCTEIKKLKKWEWETFSNLSMTDNQISEEGRFGKPFRNAFGNVQRCLTPFSLAVDDIQFSATVSRVIPDELNGDLANLRLVFIYTASYLNFFNVMHYQLAHYAEKISPSPFYPALEEPLIIKLANKSEYTGAIKCFGRWVRAIRIEKDRLYVFDFDDFVPFTNSQLKEDLEMRRLYYEFFKVPSLFVTVRPKRGDGKTLSFDEAKEIFKPGKRWQFHVTKDRDDFSAHSAYEVEFCEAKDEEEKLTVENFLIKLDD